MRLPDRVGLAVAMLLLATFGFACMDALQKLLASTYPISQILWCRYIAFTLFAFWMVGPAGARAALLSRRPLLQVAQGLLLVTESATFVLAFRFLPLADIQAVAAASPLIVLALSVPLLGEHVGIRRWLAVLTGLAGVLVILRPGFGELDWVLLIPLAGALQWGLFQILLRLCASRDGSGPTMLWTAASGLLALSLVVPFEWRTPDLHGWSLLLPIALLGTAANYALIKAFSLIEANALQPFGYSQLVWATLLGYLVFGDFPDHHVLAGSVIIVASSLYAWHRQRKLGAAGSGKLPA